MKLCYPLLSLVLSVSLFAKPRARELGFPFDGNPGKENSITDVKGVEVGHVTLIQGKGKLKIGKGPVRTGVTAILPQGKKGSGQIFAGWHSLNGNGEMTGTTWLAESGFLQGPIVLTNTHSVGVARDAVVAWNIERNRPDDIISLPVVAETWDGYLNDINGQHVQKKHVIEALNSAKSGVVAEGNVGGGTGMICFEFKCGIGTASRVINHPLGTFTVGVLTQANFGRRHQLKLAGISLGKHFPSDLVWTKETGSNINIIATDAPLLPHQLRRLAQRAGLGIARLGAVSGDGSGDIFLAFSVKKTFPIEGKKMETVEMFPNGELDPLFEAVVSATEEAVVNSMVAAETLDGVDQHKAVALPIEATLKILKDHRQLTQSNTAQ